MIIIDIIATVINHKSNHTNHGYQLSVSLTRINNSINEYVIQPLLTILITLMNHDHNQC